MRVQPLIVGTMILCSVSAPIAAGQPPAPDSSDLPAAAPPAPIGETVKRSQCAQTVPAEPFDIRPTALNFRSAWPLTRGAGQTIAVIDTGVAKHPRLSRLLAGGDYVSQSDGTEDCDVHGTLVAGLIAAEPSDDDGFSGVAPDATILSIRQSSAAYSSSVIQSADVVENSSGVGTVETMARAIRFAADSGATVINISEVACDSEIDDASLGAAVEYAAVVKDVVIVAAAGNTDTCQSPASGQDSWESATTMVSPAWYDDHVLTVGSVSSSGEPSQFTMPGPWVDVAAPGEFVVSLDPRSDGLTASLSGPEGQRVPINGTSFSAPLVAGTAALIRARFPALRAREVIRVIESTAHSPARGWDSRVGFGVIDPYDAVAAVDPANIAARHKPGSDTAQRKALAVPDSEAVSDDRGRLIALGGSAAVLGLLALGFVAVPRRRDRG